MQKILIRLLIFSTLFAVSAEAKELSVLFIGNSYTYTPGTPQDPGLPKYFRAIAKSIDPDLSLNYYFNTPGGWSFEKHFKDSTSTRLLKRHYDHVILQGHSLESLELPSWFARNQYPDVNRFLVYLPKILDLAFQNNSSVFLFVTWIRNAKDAFLQEGHPGLRFERGRSQAGQKWCGKDAFEYQEMIDQSYRKHSQNYPVNLAMVGDAWLSLQNQKVVTEDELYVAGDWSHPSELGAFVSALVLVKNVLHLDIAQNKFVPASIDFEKARKIMLALEQ